MDEVVDDATYGGIMKLAQDLHDGEVENRPAVPIRPTPPPAFRSPPAPAPLTTRVVNRLAPSADGAFVGLSSRDADKDTVRLGAAAVTLASRRGEKVVRAQIAATEARGEEETRLVRVREEERQAHFAAAAAPREANPAGHSHTKLLPPPALARLVVEQIEGKRRVRLQVLQGPRASNAASPLYANGVVFHLRTSSRLGGDAPLLHKFADQSATIVAGLLAYGVKPQRVHVAFELCSAWRVPLEKRVAFQHAMDVVKDFGPDAAIVYCALSRATRSSEDELIAIVDAAAPAHVLVAFPEEDAQLIGDDPDKVRGYLASAIATSAGQAVYAQSWWHGIDALLYNNLNGISRGVNDIPRDIEAQADVLNALLDQCSAPEGITPVVYVIARTSPRSATKRRRKRDEDERRAIAAGTPPPPPRRRQARDAPARDAPTRGGRRDAQTERLRRPRRRGCPPGRRRRVARRSGRSERRRAHASGEARPASGERRKRWERRGGRGRRSGD